MKNKYMIYEREKQKLKAAGLSAAEYQDAVRKLAQRLKI